MACDENMRGGVVAVQRGRRRASCATTWIAPLLALALLAPAIEAQAWVAPEEDWSVPIDGSGWKQAHRSRDAQQVVVEYIPSGEEIASWSHLVTTQVFFTPAGVRPRQLAEVIHQGLQQGCPSLRWSIVAASKKDVLYEWSHDGCQGFPPQHELARLHPGRFGMHRLAYTEETGRMDPAVRERWLEAITGASLVSPAPDFALAGDAAVDEE